MSTKSGTNAFHGNGAYMMRHEELDANTFENNAQNIAKRAVPRQRRRRFDRRSDPAQQAVLLQQLSRAAEQPDIDGADDRPHGARARRQLQPDVHPRREPAIPCRRASSIRSTSCRKGPDLFRRVEFPNAIIPNPDPYALRMFSFYPLPNRTPDDVFNTEQLRGDDDADGAAAQLEQPGRLQFKQPLDLRQRRHLVRRDHHAATVRRRALQRRRRHPRRQEPVHPDWATRSCSARRSCSTSATG